MVKSYLKEEERIAEKIRKFPYLYHKGNKGYKEKDRKKTQNAWREKMRYRMFIFYSKM